MIMLTWKWYRSSSRSATGTEIANQTSDSYAVTDSDVGMHIRVVATYSDGGGPEESVSFASETPVQAFRRAADNDDPMFASTTVGRRIAENSTGNVGGPVTATDANSDTLTYSKSGGADDAAFEIDRATGQLMVADGRKLNFDSTTVTAEKSNATNNTYVVQVTAHDSSGAETAPVAMVTITVFDVDEKPAFGPMDAAADAPANITGAMHTENIAGADGEFDLDIATYTATDPEGENVTLSLMGNDAGLFELAADADN